MKRYLSLLCLLLPFVGCIENLLQPVGIKHETGSCNLNEGSFYTGDITKGITVSFEWWLQTEAGSRYLGM